MVGERLRMRVKVYVWALASGVWVDGMRWLACSGETLSSLSASPRHPLSLSVYLSLPPDA